MKVEASGNSDIDKMAAEAMTRLNQGGGGLGGAGLSGKKPSPALAAALRMAANKSGTKDKDKLRETIANAVKDAKKKSLSNTNSSRADSLPNKR